MPLAAKLLALIACPVDKGALLYFEADGVLYNPRLRRKYRIDDGVPVLLADEATALSMAEHEALMARAATLNLRPNF